MKGEGMVAWKQSCKLNFRLSSPEGCAHFAARGEKGKKEVWDDFCRLIIFLGYYK